MKPDGNGHVPLRWLVDRRDGVLRGPRAERTRRHLEDGCPRCDARARRLDGFLDAIGGGPFPRPPAAVTRRAKSLYARVHRAAGLALAGALEAVLVVDQHTRFAASLRSAPGDTRRILWSVGEFDLDAGLVRRAGGTDVLAQIVPADDDPRRELEGRVELLRDGRAVDGTDIAGDGRFTFRGVPDGPHAMRGEIEGRAFVVRALVIG